MHGNVIHDNIFAKHQEYITCFACHWVHCWFFRYPPQSIRYQSSHWWPSSHWSTIHIVFVEALVLFWFSLALDTLSQEVQRAVLQQSRFHICCITHQTEPEIWFEVKNFSSAVYGSKQVFRYQVVMEYILQIPDTQSVCH